MLSNISLNTYIKELPKITVEEVVTSNVTTSLSVNSEHKPSLLNQTTIIQLQEIHDYSFLQISSKKDDINFNGTPRLEWLKDRDFNLYKEIQIKLYDGSTTIENFKEIVERNINSKTITHKEWKYINSNITAFQNGLANNKEFRIKTNDPIAHKVLDYILPKTQQRIDMLKQYLTTKTKEPEIEFTPLKDVATKETNDVAVINGSLDKKTNDLLDFLTKDLKWYKWYLEDQKNSSTSYSLKFLQLSYIRQLEISGFVA